MAGSRCSQCGREEFLPFRCKLCAQPHCLDHRLPENHKCLGLGEYRSRVREERVFGVPVQDDVPEGLKVKVRGGSRGREALDRASRWSRRSMSHRLLAAIFLVYAAQVAASLATGRYAALVGPFGDADLLTCVLAIGSCGTSAQGMAALLAKPWSPLTSIFVHLGIFHFFFNALFLYFFGQAVEQRVGPRRLLGLFLVAGVVAGPAQLAIMSYAGSGFVIAGASGGLMGLLGTLTVLAPHMMVLLFFVPVPLWILAILFAIGDIVGIFGGPTTIANLAHLAGLAIGLAYGYRLKRRGVLPRIASSWAFQRRS